MNIQQMKTPLVVSWLIALAVTGVLGSFGIPGWTMLGGLALIPLLVLRQMQGGPAQTMSETIRAARR